MGIKVDGTLSFHGNPSDISHNNPYGIEVRTGGIYLQPEQVQVFFSENQIADLMTSAFLILRCRGTAVAFPLGSAQRERTSENTVR